MRRLSTLALIAMVLRSTQGSSRRWSRSRRKMSDRRNERRKMKRAKRKRKTETERGDRVKAESLASTLPLLFASAADVVVRKGGKKSP